MSVSSSTGLHKVHLEARRAGASGRAGLGQSGSADERREERRPRSPAGTCEGDTAAAAPGKGVCGPVLLTRGVSLNPGPRDWAEPGPHVQNRAAHASRSPHVSRHASPRLDYQTVAMTCALSLVVSDSLGPHGLQPASSSIHRIFQASILEWVAISFSRGSS